MNLDFDPFPYASKVSGYAAMVTMLDGRRANTDDIVFSEPAHRFTLRGEDVTNQIRQADKLTNWRTFDRAKDNARVSDERYQRETGKQRAPAGSTSTTGLFLTQIFTEPFKAPIEAAQRGTEGIGGLKGVGMIALIGVGALIMLNLTKR